MPVARPRALPRPTSLPAALLMMLAVVACSPAAQGSAEATATASAGGASSAPSATAAPSASAIPAVEDVATATLTVDGGPDFPLAAFDSLWLLAPDGDDQSVVRVDPATNETIVRIPIPSSPCQGLVAGDDAVWVCVPEGVARVDPATNTITGTIPYDVGPSFGRLAFGAGAVWSLGSDGFAQTNLVRIDPASEEVTTFPLGHPGGTIAFGFEALWVTVRDEGLLLRVDPGTGEVTEHTSGLEDPWTVAVGPDSVWVTLQGTSEARPGPDDPTVARVGPDDGTILARIATGSGPGPYGGMWAEADAVWLRAPDLFLVRIDPASNAVVARFTGPPTSGAVTVAFGSVWATAVERQWVFRLDP